MRLFYVENKNHDYGGYSSVVRQLKEQLYGYEYYIFVNSSVRGPFLRFSGMDWVDCFVRLISSDVGLVGSSINILPGDSKYSEMMRINYNFSAPYSHVQTTAYALSGEVFHYLVSVGFFGLADAVPKDELICYYEVGLSQEVKKAGWNLAACLERYNSIDYRLPHDDINPTSRKGDPLYKGAYFGETASCDELVFIKTNRNLIGEFYLCLRTWRELCRVNSPLVVGWCEYKRLRRYLLLKALCSPLLSLWRKVAREK